MNELQGLSTAEVLARRAAGQGNNVRFATSRSYAAIVRENAFTFINNVLFGIGIVLVVMGRLDNAVVTAGLVLLNVIVGVVQEGRAKRKLDQIALLTRPKATVVRDGQETQVDPGEIVLGDVLLVRPGDQIVVDGRVMGSGRMEVDESLLTGESDLVPKQAGDQLLSGSFCVTGSGAFEATRVGAGSYANQMTADARAFRRVKTPLQQDVDFVIRMMVLLAATLGLLLAANAIMKHMPAVEWVEVAAVIVVLVPQGLFFMTTVTYATGAVRMAGKGALIQQANAIESMSNVDVLCMDKTGTLTTNRIRYQAMQPLGIGEAELRQALGDFVASATDRNRTAEAIAAALTGQPRQAVAEVPFSSARKWSALAFADGAPAQDVAHQGDLHGLYVLGAPEMLQPYVEPGAELDGQLEEWAGQGLRVLLFARHPETAIARDGQGEPCLPAGLVPLGLVSFSDELRSEAQQTLREFADAGIQLKIISGDNPQTVAALAGQAGFDPRARAISGLELAKMDAAQFGRAAEEASIFGRITPQQKEKLVAALRGAGHYVGMIGDGVNDVLSLKGAQLGIAMQTGSQATRSVADMVLLDDSFAALPAAFREGQRIVRGMQDVMRLFLTRTFYLTMLIVAAAIIGVPFPITPKHNFVLALLTVGIPTLALAAWARPVPAGRKSVASGRPHSNLLVIRHFVFSAACTIALLGLVVYVGYLYTGGSLGLARSALSSATVFCGLLLIVFVEPPTAAWVGGDEYSGDWRPTLLALLMLVVYGLGLVIPGLRRFFELTPMPALDLALIVVLVALWALAQRTIWRRNLFERLFDLR